MGILSGNKPLKMGEINMKDRISMIKNMVMEFILGIMEQNVKWSTRMAFE